MSSVVEMAKAEADAVEAELGTDDPEPVAEPVPEPVPEPEPPAFDGKTDKAMERVLKTYYDGLKRVLGAALDDLHVCPGCAETLPGFVLALPQPLDGFEPDRTKQECPECKGLGQLRSGSKTDNALVMCMNCTGNGYVSHQPAMQPTYGNPGYGAASVPPGYLPPSSESMPMRDMWGRPQGHPHFGIDPATIGG